MAGIDAAPFDATTDAVEVAVCSEANACGGGGSAGIFTRGIAIGNRTGLCLIHLQCGKIFIRAQSERLIYSQDLN
jgi:hypothetical protein